MQMLQAVRFPIVRKSTRKRYRSLLKVLADEPMAPHKREWSRRVYAHREPIPLFAGTTGKVVAYACGSCGSVQAGKQHGLGHAKNAARSCCLWRDHCNKCGCEIEPQRYTCDRCRARNSWETAQARVRKAQVVEDDGSPVWSMFGNGSWGEGYSASVADMLDDWADEHAPEDPGAEETPPPPFVFCTRPVKVEIDQQWIDESLVDELHEDFDVTDLPGHADLCEAIETFNAAQRNRGRAPAHQIDYRRIVVIDRDRYLAYLEESWDGTPDIRWRLSADPARIPVFGQETAPDKPPASDAATLEPDLPQVADDARPDALGCGGVPSKTEPA